MRPLNPTICFILPDRDITKIAETVLVSAICLILPFCFVTPEISGLFHATALVVRGLRARALSRLTNGSLRYFNVLRRSVISAMQS